jgi:hypothetical protein
MREDSVWCLSNWPELCNPDENTFPRDPLAEAVENSVSSPGGAGCGVPKLAFVEGYKSWKDAETPQSNPSGGLKGFIWNVRYCEMPARLVRFLDKRRNELDSTELFFSTFLGGEYYYV